MRIKKIEVVGFKSFADRELIVLDDRITGVIGPNGCGKSNIVDAIRWCLGEQRPKHLRGSGMADVIFGGSVARGPAGLAEVTITFENDPSSPDAPVGLLPYAEIAVCRRLFRDGTSEYLLNKVPCRLRDITDMLMGTGVGSRGYSIIEQGQVGAIVTSKPETRRHVLDEAAGITKFNAQKKAAERKIDQTKQNLLRVTDVLHELDGRLGSLRRQAQKAERYKRYKDELRDLELWSATHRFLEFQGSGRVLEERHFDLTENVGALRNETSARETRLEAERLSLRELEVQLQREQQALYDLENRIGLVEQDRRYKQQEREGLARSVDQCTTEISTVMRVIEGLEHDLSQLDGQVAELGGGEEGEELARVERLAREFDERGDALRDASGALETKRAERGRAEARLSGLEARRSSRGEALAEIEVRLASLSEEIALLETTHADALVRCEQCERELELAVAQLAALRTTRGELDRERVELREHVAGAEVEVETARRELLRARSRLQSLEEIQSRYRGCGSGVQVVMEHRAEFGAAELGAEPVRGIMADFITAPAHLEPAVGAMLADRLQGIVVDGHETAAKGIALLKKAQEGRSTFMPARPTSKASSASGSTWAAPRESAALGRIEVVDLSDTPPANGPTGAGPRDLVLERSEGVLGRLSDLVQIDPRVGGLAEDVLARTVVVDELGRALELWQTHRPSQTLVTLEGDRVEPDGVIVGGAGHALESALLQQRREIDELRAMTVELEAVLDRARARHLGIAERVHAVEGAREQSEIDILQAEKRRLGADKEREAGRAAVERASDRRAAVEDESLRLAEDVRTRRAELTDLDAEDAQLRAAIPELDRTVLATQANCEALATDRTRLTNELTEAKVALAAWQEQRNALSSARHRLSAQLSSERQRVQRLAASAEEARSRSAMLEREIISLGEEHHDLLTRHEQAARDKQGSVEATDVVRLAVDALELGLRNLRRELDEERERLADVELGLREIRLERDHLCADILDRFDMRLQDALIDHHDRPLAGEAEQAKARDLKRILARMGEVNLTAITEFEEVSQRFDWLTSQRVDLESAIEQLQSAIDRINKTTKERFRETFHRVNEMFQKLFPRLFSGGRAELVLTDPNDLLTTGVEIMAQPPGKNVSSLELLSGGEKALTAVSLIFSVFLTKQSPFCLLDEVDAPLDEANVGRFCDLVMELAQATQFILITHNKRTMEIADRLYGVTMQQKGVSKLVSVNLRRTADEVRYQS